MRSIVNSTLPSPGTPWLLNTAFASTVPSAVRTGDTYPTGTGLGGFAIPDNPPYVQLALVCVCVPSHVTVQLDNLTRGPPAGTKAVSSKFLPVAVDLVEFGSVFVQDDVPPPNVMPGFESVGAVADVGPSIEQRPWAGTVTVEPSFVNDAEPMSATPGAVAADAGEAATAVTTTAVTIVLRICSSSTSRASLPRLNIRPPETSVAPGISDHPFGDREPPGGGVMFVTVSAGQRVNDRAAQPLRSRGNRPVHE
ncbi:hypothetical protein ACWEGE_03545 [Amycolatopsis sp. NPDC004747]